jgi:hypothetical protein
MPTLVTEFNWGKDIYDENPNLTRQLSQSYSETARAVNTKVSKYTTDGIQKPHVDPPVNDQFNQNFEIGDIYVRTDTNSAWIMTSRTTSQAATWSIIT